MQTDSSRLTRGLERTTNIAVIVIAIGVAITVGGRQFGLGQSRSPAKPKPDSVVVADWSRYTLGGRERGPANAPLTILVFGDYECPFCRRFDEQAEKVLAAYPTQVRLVYRHWPLQQHRFAYPAARAAECAHDQGQFWSFHALLYQKADSLGLLPFDEFARRAGVRDLSAFRVCNARTTPIASIETGARDAKEIGATGTPAVIVNGVLRRTLVDSAYISSLLSRTQRP
jgi:protein-disulfide isomerase